ncbi:hypothetical protein OH707_04395 [Pseudomonas capsici]|nr:hypothetical protein [Pseudomonas capsici]
MGNTFVAETVVPEGTKKTAGTISYRGGRIKSHLHLAERADRHFTMK